MKRGTTAKHTFRTNTDLTNATVFVTYKQGNSIVLEKTNADIDITPRKIIVGLTQEDTLSFKAGQSVTAQVRYVRNDGTADASNVVSISVQDVLKDGEIEYVEPAPTPATSSSTASDDNTNVADGTEQPTTNEEDTNE